MDDFTGEGILEGLFEYPLYGSEGMCEVKHDLMGSHYPFEVSMEQRVVP